MKHGGPGVGGGAMAWGLVDGEILPQLALSTPSMFA